MSNLLRRTAASALACAFLAACTSTSKRIIDVSARGLVVGAAVVDVNGDNQVNSPDHLYAGLGFLLLNGRDTVASATTGSGGTAVLPNLSVGRYQVLVDSATIPDSLRLEALDSPYVTVGAGDSVGVIARLTYPRLTVAQAREALVGRRVFVEGVALNNWATYGDSTLDIEDSSGAMRVVRLAPANVAAGDSVRVLGSISSRLAQPVLQAATAFFIQTVQPPETDTIGTAEAADADKGALDAALVAVKDATIQDSTFTPTGDLSVTIDDGSGPLDVLLDRNIAFFIPRDSTLVGHHVQATGLLVPSQPGVWVLKPRASNEFVVLPR